MITGSNLKLIPPIIEYETGTLKANPEIQSMIKSLEKYYSQKNNIYEAKLIMTNQEWATYEMGKRRVNYEVELLNLEKVILHDKSIDFITPDTHPNVNVRITQKFFYSIEWESDYYM